MKRFFTLAACAILFWGGLIAMSCENENGGPTWALPAGLAMWIVMIPIMKYAEKQGWIEKDQEDEPEEQEQQ